MRKLLYSEIFLGLVAPVGIDVDGIMQLINDYLRNHYNYNPQLVRLSDLIKNVKGVKTKVDSSSEFLRIDTSMTAGNEVRSKHEQEDILARYSIVEVQNIRGSDKPKQNNAYVFRSIKNPKESLLYRQVYGKGFFQLGFFSKRKKKIEYLIKNKGMTEKEANYLIRRDEDELDEYGQQTRKTFYTSDVFFDVDDTQFKYHLKRFFDLIFGNPYRSPTLDEYAMFLAFASSFRSCDLSRQVGAVITSKDGEIIATGCNEVPKFGGGLYWSEDENDMRDFKKKYDSNEKQKQKIASKIKTDFNKLSKKSKISNKAVDKILKSSGIFDITEYGRSVHAEMEALLACSREGLSPRGGTIYSTTFPCHNCAKHIIASGIEKVVFVEPYPKSKAIELHDDSIGINLKGRGQEKLVNFQTFIGVGPRRFIDLFSLNFSNGVKIRRKEKGKVIEWREKDSIFRFPLVGMSYLDKEISIGGEIGKEFSNGKKKK